MECKGPGCFFLKRLHKVLYRKLRQRLTAASEYFPKIGLKGELHRRWNSYDGGLTTPGNRNGWSVDLGVEIPIFNGFLTQAKVAEARARINQLKERNFFVPKASAYKSAACS